MLEPQEQDRESESSGTEHDMNQSYSQQLEEATSGEFSNVVPEEEPNA